MQSVSETCDNEIKALAWLAPNVDANSGTSRNDVMNGLANPLVICSDTPRSMEKMKNKAIFFCLNNAKARSPSASTTLFFSLPRLTGQLGSVMA